MALYVKFAIKQRPKTINEFLLLFYTQDTFYNQAHAEYTYYDKSCKKVHCTKIRRSFDDLLELVKTYYPSTTPKILISKLLKLKIPDYPTIYLTSCNEMKKLRISYYKKGLYTKSYESIIITNKYNSKYSWGELLSKININSQKEFDEYIK